MISIQNLTRNYGSITAVRDVSVKIEHGEIVGLLGHNGAGKTTVMKVLTGYLEPSAGTVSVGGVDVTTDRIGVQRQVGYLPENAPLYPEMLVQEYLLMIAELRGMPPAEARTAAAEAAEATGLTPRLTQRISTLSKGFRQRVGIAQAILHKPDVLVLDEPTNGLDPMQIQSIRELIRTLGKDSTIVLSTHILQEIEAVCDRVLVMINGELAADAPLEELLTTHDVRLAVKADAQGVAESLVGVSGVDSVDQLGEDPSQPGFHRYALRCSDTSQPIPEIVALASQRGWTIGAIHPEHRTLQAAVEQLQADHIERQAAGRASS